MTGSTRRRTLLLVTVAVGVGALLAWRRNRATTPTPAAPPQWPDWPTPVEPAPTPTPAPAPAPAAAMTATSTWVRANDDGSAPDSHPIKAKESSGIFHLPGGRFYDRTNADRCYTTAAAAEADGYRQSKT
jgi:hypothetical protein